MADNVTNLLDPSGQLVGVSPEQVQDALTQGYTPAGPEHVAKFAKEQKFGTLGQQAITGLEGAAEGVAGPLATAAESALGVDPQDILARRETNPISHGAGQIAGLGLGVAAGEGLAPLAARAGEGVAALTGLEGIAGTAVKTGAELASLQASDEVSRLMMKDPSQSVETAVSDVGLAGLIGLGGGALFGSIGAGAKSLSEKHETFLNDFVERLKSHFGADEMPLESPVESVPTAEGASPTSALQPSIFSGAKKSAGSVVDANAVSPDVTSPLKPNFFSGKKSAPLADEAQASLAPPSSNPGDASPQVSSAGTRFADFVIGKGLSKLGAEGLGTSAGYLFGKGTGIPGGGTIGALVGERALAPFLQTVLPVLAKPLTEKLVSTEGMKAAADYGLSIIRGAKLMKGAAAAVLDLKGSKTLDTVDVSDKETAKLDKQLAEYEKNPDALLELGGKLGHYLPDHAAALSQTALKAIQYLNSQRPKDSQGLAFDTPRKPSGTENAQWNRTLKIAQQPLTTMKLLSEGRLNHQDLITVSTLYPSFYSSMKQNLMSSVVEAKEKGVAVPYAKRTSLALFLGEPLDSTMTPQAIQSIQATFAASRARTQGAGPQTGGKPKGSPSKLDDISALSATGDQAREKDRQLKG